MLTNQNVVLMTVLECGSADLCILDDIEYDIREIVEDLLDNCIKPTLNRITDSVFRLAVSDMKYAIDEQLTEVKSDYADLDFTSLDDSTTAEIKEVEDQICALQQLDPDRDIEWYCNCLDTSIFFVRNEELYRDYLNGTIEQVERQMGFSFGG